MVRLKYRIVKSSGLEIWHWLWKWRVFFAYWKWPTWYKIQRTNSMTLNSIFLVRWSFTSLGSLLYSIFQSYYSLFITWKMVISIKSLLCLSDYTHRNINYIYIYMKNGVQHTHTSFIDFILIFVFRISLIFSGNIIIIL